MRRQLLCEELPPPPPNAGGVPQVDPKATTRERFRQHTSVAFCKSCHQYIDDLGFGFERFDAVGKWRDAENGQPIDGIGDLNDREALGSLSHAPYSSLKELGTMLAESDRARSCLSARRFAMLVVRRKMSQKICAHCGNCKIASVTVATVSKSYSFR